MNNESMKAFEKRMREGFGWDDSDFVMAKVGYKHGTTADTYSGWSARDAEIATKNKRIAELEENLAYANGRYIELVMAVESKHIHETRHETALRYIREAETPGNDLAQEEDQR